MESRNAFTLASYSYISSSKAVSLSNATAKIDWGSFLSWIINSPFKTKNKKASFNKNKFNLSSFEFLTALDVRFVVRSGAEGVEIWEDSTPAQTERRFFGLSFPPRTSMVQNFSANGVLIKQYGIAI